MGLVGMEFVDKVENDDLPKGICELGFAKAVLISRISYKDFRISPV